MKLIQHDYDDGFQELEIITENEHWFERRKYIGDSIETYYVLRQEKVPDVVIYNAIQHISKCVSTSRKPKQPIYFPKSPGPLTTAKTCA